MPLRPEDVKKLKREPAKYFKCDCGVKLPKRFREVRCWKCSLRWKIRKHFAFNRTNFGTAIVYFQEAGS